LDRNQQFSHLKKVIARRIGLNGEISAFVGNVEVDDTKTLNELGDVLELRIGERDGWKTVRDATLDFSSLVLVRSLSENRDFPVELYQNKRKDQEIVVKSFPYLAHFDFFKCELDALLKIAHPCVVRFCGHFKNQNSAKLATRFVSDLILASAIKLKSGSHSTQMQFQLLCSELSSE